jgi:hypothetical protein
MFVRQYPLGYYDDRTGQSRNFKQEKHNPMPNRDPELNFRRQQILSSFESTGVFTLPHPGRKFAEYSSLTDLDEDFTLLTKQFIEHIFHPTRLHTKNVGGLEVTGIQFKSYVQQWAPFFLDSKTPKLQNILATNAELQNRIALIKGLDCFKNSMESFLSSHPNGLADSVLDRKYQELFGICMRVFRGSRTLGGAEFESKYARLLEGGLLDSYKVYKKRNLEKMKAAQRKILLQKNQEKVRALIPLIEAQLRKKQEEAEAVRVKHEKLMAETKAKEEAACRELKKRNEQMLRNAEKKLEEERVRVKQEQVAARLRTEQLQREALARLSAQMAERARIRQQIYNIENEDDDDFCSIM